MSVGVYVDGLLATGTNAAAVSHLFAIHTAYLFLDVGAVRKVL